MNGTGKSISADWIGRDLYWTEQEAADACVVKSYDLYKDDGHIKTIVRRGNMIEKLALNPYKRCVALTLSRTGRPVEVTSPTTMLSSSSRTWTLRHPQNVIAHNCSESGLDNVFPLFFGAKMILVLVTYFSGLAFLVLNVAGLF